MWPNVVAVAVVGAVEVVVFLPKLVCAICMIAQISIHPGSVAAESHGPATDIHLTLYFFIMSLFSLLSATYNVFQLISFIFYILLPTTSNGIYVFVRKFIQTYCLLHFSSYFLSARNRPNTTPNGIVVGCVLVFLAFSDNKFKALQEI